MADRPMWGHWRRCKAIDYSYGRDDQTRPGYQNLGHYSAEYVMSGDLYAWMRELRKCRHVGIGVHIPLRNHPSITWNVGL